MQRVVRLAGRRGENPPFWPLLIVGLGTLVVPLDSAVNIDFSAIVDALRAADPDDPVGRHRLCADADLPDADVRPHRRHVGLPADLPVRHRRSARLPSSPARWRRPMPRCWPGGLIQGVGAGLILSCGPALATSLFPEAMRTQVLARYMMMFGIGSALGPVGVRVAGGTLRLERGVQFPRADRRGGVRAGLDAAPPGARGARTVRCRRRRAAGAGAELHAADAEPAAPAGSGDGGVRRAGGGRFVLFYRQERRAAKPIIDFAPFRDRPTSR